MISQQNFVSPVILELMEEEDPQISLQGGGFKTRNPKIDPLQRRFVHVSKTRFNKTIELLTTLHGWDTPAKTRPMTLIVMRLHLSCSTPGHRYKSATIRLKFGEKVDAKWYKGKVEEGKIRKLQPPKYKALPKVVAYAPFVETARFNETNTTQSIRRKLQGTLGVDGTVSAQVVAGGTRVETFNRSYFNEGTANPIIADDTNQMIGVKWYLEQNSKQNHGIGPDVRIAVLLERKTYKEGDDDIQAQFVGSLDLETEAGLLEDFKTGARRVFGLPEDDDVIFDPNLPGQGNGTVGNALLGVVEEYKDNMAALADDEDLLSLSSICGLDPIKAKS